MDELVNGEHTEDTMKETPTQMRLRRAKEELLIAKDKVSVARQELHHAEEIVRKLNARASDLFLQEEREEIARRMVEYRHTTN